MNALLFLKAGFLAPSQKGAVMEEKKEDPTWLKLLYKLAVVILLLSALYGCVDGWVEARLRSQMQREQNVDRQLNDLDRW